MDADPFSLELSQLTLFETAASSQARLELFPAVWAAADALTSPDEATRRTGLAELSRLGAARFSPLVVYVLATRLNEPDLPMRAQAARLLAQVLQPVADGKYAPDNVRLTLKQALAQMRTRQVFALLQAVEADAEVQPCVVTLLGECSYAGNHLVDIFSNRSLPMWARKLSIVMCGEVGFLTALPALERLAGRLEARQNGQQSMPFLPKDSGDKGELLPILKQAIARLRAP
jgi:predicted O-linked N-acetylglucosamine transferase (SPINDLY family)